jgi:hypothetical protein
MELRSDHLKWNDALMSPSSSLRGGAADHILAGRFRLDLPSQIVRGTQESTVKRVDIMEFDLSSGLPPDEAARRFWRGHVSKIKRARRNDDADTVLEEGYLGPARPYLHYSDPGACVPVFETLLYCPTHLILFQAGTTFHRTVRVLAPRSEYFTPAILAGQRRTTLEVLASYHPRPTTGGVNPEWFHTAKGSVALPYTRERELWTDFHGQSHPCLEERSRLTLAWSGLELSFTTWHPSEDEAGLLGRTGGFAYKMEETFEKSRDWSVPYRTIRFGSRTVAGFSGTEDIIHSDPNGCVLFRWRHAGGRAGYDPRMQFYAKCKDVRIDRKAEIWDEVLGNLSGLLPIVARLNC